MTEEKNSSTDTESGKDSEKTTHTTTFSGPVTSGAISTGSGDIYIEKQALVVSTKEEFLVALDQLKKKLILAQQQGLLPEDVTDDVTIEIEAAEREAGKESPQSDRVIKRLENAKELLIEVTGVATATTAAITAANGLLPFIQAAIHTASKLF